MTLTYTPQHPLPNHSLVYDVQGDILTITHSNGEVETVDTFDFTGTPDGILDLEGVETTLPVQPIVKAERVGGVLTVTVLDWSGTDG